MSALMISWIDRTPYGIKALYVAMLKVFKTGLKATGLLRHLDQKARTEPKYHYLRSLLSLHQLDDMIALDVPWWTYPAATWIDRYLRDLPGSAMVFEYGAGASTLWLAKRAAQIVSVEHDTLWYQRLLAATPGWDNIVLLHCPPKPMAEVPAGQTIMCSPKYPDYDFTQYVEAIQQTNQKFDLIIIDGRCREACLKAALPYLKPTGVIVFDNTDRTRYQSALNAVSLNQYRLKGRVPGSPFVGETALISNIKLS